MVAPTSLTHDDASVQHHQGPGLPHHTAQLLPQYQVVASAASHHNLTPPTQPIPSVTIDVRSKSSPLVSAPSSVQVGALPVLTAPEGLSARDAFRDIVCFGSAAAQCMSGSRIKRRALAHWAMKSGGTGWESIGRAEKILLMLTSADV